MSAGELALILSAGFSLLVISVFFITVTHLLLVFRHHAINDPFCENVRWCFFTSMIKLLLLAVSLLPGLVTQVGK